MALNSNFVATLLREGIHTMVTRNVGKAILRNYIGTTSLSEMPKQATATPAATQSAFVVSDKKVARF